MPPADRLLKPAEKEGDEPPLRRFFYTRNSGIKAALLAVTSQKEAAFLINKSQWWIKDLKEEK